jgi:histidine triad (HIT) family protein
LGITVEPSACPFCKFLAGEETVHNRRSDVVWRDETTTAFVSPKWWDCSRAHVIVIPNDHFENLYDIPERALGEVYATAKRVAVALKSAYGCDATSTRQHNERGAGQEVWHFHVHVFPRYAGDGLYEKDAEFRWAGAEERAPYAERVRRSLGS